ncbi:MAG: DUF4416 family protein [Candidatus Omnitrophica bacterium]|nr:DUF4416 family protein [Candidatus Omnitrophota bacterium]
MGNIIKQPGVKLISGFIFKEERIFAKAAGILKKRFGPIDLESPGLAFSYTDYYKKEFGEGLTRKFLSFKRLIRPQELWRIKIYTNKIEKKLSVGAWRQINIDPGYLDLAKLVLATTKDYSHRVYLNNGIFAEVTLFYQGKTYCHWDWTYPDYRTQDYIAIFNQIRQIYAGQI